MMIKNAMILCGSLLFFATVQPLFAQGDSAAYYEERIRTLTSRVEELTQSHSDLVKAINSLQRQCTRLAEEVDSLRSKVNVPIPPPDLSGAASVESVRQLKASLVALENRFIANEKDRDRDNRQILERLDKLAKIAPAAPPPSEPRTPAPKASEVYSGKSYEWTVAEGDTLSGIVKTVNASGGKTSLAAIQKANPGINSNTLRIGQKIIIPDIGK